MESAFHKFALDLAATERRQSSQRRPELAGSVEVAGTWEALFLDEASMMELRAFFALLDQWDREAHATTIL